MDTWDLGIAPHGRELLHVSDSILADLVDEALAIQPVLALVVAVAPGALRPEVVQVPPRPESMSRDVVAAVHSFIMIHGSASDAGDVGAAIFRRCAPSHEKTDLLIEERDKFATCHVFEYAPFAAIRFSKDRPCVGWGFIVSCFA